MDPAEAQNTATVCLKKYVADNWEHLASLGINPEEIVDSLPG